MISGLLKVNSGIQKYSDFEWMGIVLSNNYSIAVRTYGYKPALKPVTYVRSWHVYQELGQYLIRANYTCNNESIEAMQYVNLTDSK